MEKPKQEQSSRDSAGSRSQNRQSQHEQQSSSSSAATTRQQQPKKQQQQHQQQHQPSQQSPLHQSQPLHHQSQQSSSSLPPLYHQQHVPFHNSPSTTMPIQLNPPSSSRSAMAGIGGQPPPTGMPSESIPPRQPPTVHSTYSPPNLTTGTQPSPQPPPGSATTPSFRTGSILNPIPNPSAPPGYQSLPFPPNRSMVPGPPPPPALASPIDRDDASTAEAATVVARARSTSSRLSPEPALTLLPEEQRAIGNGARRPFQRRRRSRACDACRMRKTKCDTPDAGPCASCTAASLVCKFSEGGDEKRRIGPARQLRVLESQVQVLKMELAREKQLVASLRSGVDPARPSLGPTPMWPQPDSRDQYSAGFAPSGSTPMRPEMQYPSQGGNMMGFQQPLVPVPMQLSNTGGAEGFVGMPGIATDDRNALQPGLQGLSSTRPKRYSTDSEAEMEAGDQQGGPLGKRNRNEESNWGGQYYGSTSAPTFANGYEQFAEHLGFAPSVNPAFNPDLPGVFNSPIGRLATDHPPLLSDNLSNMSTSTGAMIGGGGDLRRLLPPRELAEKLKEAFRSTIQQYTSMFYWPIFESTWVKTFSEPIYENDKDKIRENLCVVLMVMAVGAQVCTDDVQYQEAPGYYHPIFQGCFSGWKFFEVARKLLNLNSPVYSVAYCTIFILMSLYLDGASLPSPTWLAVGATGRVCQDLGLHKPPPDGTMSSIDIECRNRLFWTAFLIDQKLALCLGRHGVLGIAQADVTEPGTYDSQGTGCDDGPSPINSNWPYGDAKALSTFRGNISICANIQSITNFAVFGADDQADMDAVLRIDNRLRIAWNRFPSEYASLDISGPVDVSALRALAIPQHTRLLMFRFFSDFSKPLTHRFRNFCLVNSTIISSFTAHLLQRCELNNPDFERQFAIRTNDFVHIHVFRVATILLLCHIIKERCDANNQLPISDFQDVQLNHLQVCIRALRSAANRHPAAKRYYGLFEGFAILLRFDIESSSSHNSPTPGQGDMTFSAESGEGSPGDYGPFSASGGGTYSNIGNTGMMEGGQSGSGSGGLDMSQVVGMGGAGINWDVMRNMMENDAQFGSLMGAGVSNEHQSSMLPTPSSGIGSTAGMVGGVMGSNPPGLPVVVNPSEQGGPSSNGAGRSIQPDLMGHGSMGPSSGMQTGWEGV